MELTSLQLSTTNEILNLYNPNEKVVCEFKSPTGSGKTLMATYFISALINQNPSDRFIFVIATPSSSSLPYFFEQKINKYKINLPYSKFEVEYIQSPSTTRADKSESIPKIIPEQNKVYIFGKASFGKNRILSEFGIINDFVISAKDKGYKLVYIRDEAHIGGEDRTNDENFETVMNQNASFILKMTATPDNDNPLTKKVILTENQLNNPALNDGKWLLKTKAVSLVNSDMNNEDILNDAINQFRDIKNKYTELNIGINPAMLIQVNNNSPSNPERRQAFNQAIEKIKNTLNKQNISWVQYFGDNDKDSNRVYKDKFTLDDITENNNDIDAIIFKIGPSTGWDIPRACMLVQLREVSSASLNIQTLGRIKRNPYPNLEKNPITDEYYVYSNIANNNNETKEYNYNINQKFSAEEFLSVDITNKNEIKTSKSNDQFKDNFGKWLNDNKNKLIQEIGTVFVGHQTYRKVLQNVNGHQIYTELTNPFIFLRDYNRLINANKQLYNLIESISEDFCKENNIQKEFLITVLFDLHKREYFEGTIDVNKGDDWN